MSVRRRSLVLPRASVCAPPPPRAIDAAAVIACAGCTGESSDNCDFVPIVRLPRPRENRDCGCGRSVSEPERDVHGDEALALSGVTGVSAADNGGASPDDGRCRCSPPSAPTLTVSGRENATEFECPCRLELAPALEDADADDWPESVRETGIVVTAVVGTALAVVMVKPGLALVLPRVLTVEMVEILRRVVDVALSVCACFSEAARDSEGRVGSGAGMVSGGSLRTLSSRDWRGRGAGVGEGS